jgi:hypothetical protein
MWLSGKSSDGPLVGVLILYLLVGFVSALPLLDRQIEWLDRKYRERYVNHRGGGLRREFGSLFLGGITQDSTYGSAPDSETAGNLGFADAGAMQCS